MEEHKEIFLEKAKEIGFYVPEIGTKVDNPDAEAKAREWLDTKGGGQEAARYCIVCGHIPFTPENVALVGDEDFYFSGAIPDGLKEKILKLAEGVDRTDWNYESEDELEHLRLIETDIDGIWIQNGAVKEARITEKRVVRVLTRYDVELKQKIE